MTAREMVAEYESLCVAWGEASRAEQSARNVRERFARRLARAIDPGGQGTTVRYLDGSEIVVVKSYAAGMPAEVRREELSDIAELAAAGPVPEPAEGSE